MVSILSLCTPPVRVVFFSQTWGGVIGALGLEEEGGGADFYASYYNDHVRRSRHEKQCTLTDRGLDR